MSYMAQLGGLVTVEACLTMPTTKNLRSQVREIIRRRPELNRSVKMEFVGVRSICPLAYRCNSMIDLISNPPRQLDINLGIMILLLPSTLTTHTIFFLLPSVLFSLPQTGCNPGYL